MPHSSAAARHSDEPGNTGRTPVDKFVNGAVHVSIWENTGAKGAFRIATIQLRYKDEKKGWRTGNSYGASDLKHLENAAIEARSRIENWQQRRSFEASPGAIK